MRAAPLRWRRRPGDRQRGTSRRSIGAPPARTDAFIFQTTTNGAQVAFSRYGADYLVEFECKELVNGLPACITEDEAVAFARDLAISGTR